MGGGGWWWMVVGGGGWWCVVMGGGGQQSYWSDHMCHVPCIALILVGIYCQCLMQFC